MRDPCPHPRHCTVGNQSARIAPSAISEIVLIVHGDPNRLSGKIANYEVRCKAKLSI